MLAKLSILFVIMSKYSVNLLPEHAKILLTLIQNTNFGELLIAIYTQLHAVSNEWETVFIIESKLDETTSTMRILIVVDIIDRFEPHIELLTKINNICKQNNIILGMDVMENFTRSELLPF